MAINTTRIRYQALALVFGLTLIGCGSDQGPYGDIEVIGSVLKPVSMASTADAEKAYVFDKQSERIHYFNLDQGTLLGSYATTNKDEAHNIFVPDTENYVVDFSPSKLVIHQKNGQIVSPNLGFLGTPISADFDDSTRTLVVYDSLASIGLVRLNEDGSVLTSWVGGPIFDQNTLVKSGSFAAGGKLVLAFSSNQIGVIDVTATLAAGSWQYSLQTPGPAAIDWVAPVASRSDLIALHGSGTLTVWNMDTQAVSATADLTAGTRTGYFKAKIPHIYYTVNDTRNLYMINNDGTISSTVLPLNYTAMQSAISSDQTSVTLIAQPDSSSSQAVIRQIRLSDGLSQVNLEITVNDNIVYGIGSKYMISLYPSQLGFMEVTELVSQEKRQVAHYNIEYYR